jgi:hypothetical protein
MKCKAEGCPNEVEPATGNRPREYCTDRCRKRAAARSAALPTTKPGSSALDGLNDWLEHRTGLPESLMSAATAIAGQLDAQPSSAPLWGRYLDALAALSASAAERERRGIDVINDLRTEIASAEAADEYRRERRRAAIEAGDEDEAKRWDRLVPIGCARGDHRWHQWPAGLRECADCRLDAADLAST